MALFEVCAIDNKRYHEELENFLPKNIYDIHCHLWLKSFSHSPHGVDPRAVSWPYLVAQDNSIQALEETYRLIFPGKQVVPLVFANPQPQDDITPYNTYVAQQARQRHYPALYYSHPAQSATQVEKEVLAGEFLGLKSYLNLAPAYIPEAEIRITDFFPPHHLHLLNKHGWVMMLHLPRPARLRDEVNLAELAYILTEYPRIRVILAHVGRAYCVDDLGQALERLCKYQGLLFDFSANCNPGVLRRLLDAVGPERVLFGSDLPITRMRMRRICENGQYVNLVPPGLYGDISADVHMREEDPQVALQLSFFLYEQIGAMKTALYACGWGRKEAEMVFCTNAEKLLASVVASKAANQERRGNDD